MVTSASVNKHVTYLKQLVSHLEGTQLFSNRRLAWELDAKPGSVA